MKQPCALPRLYGLRHGAELWLLSAILFASVSVARAQSSVTVKVETLHGRVISGAKVSATTCPEPPNPTTKCFEPPEGKKVIDVLDVPEKETGKYTADRLRKGFYLLFACDATLTYEPAQSERFQLGDNDSKKIPTLVLGDTGDEVPVSGKVGAKICLIHKVTGCKATKEIDAQGTISIRGDRDHYDYKPPEACNQDRERGL